MEDGRKVTDNIPQLFVILGIVIWNFHCTSSRVFHG
jgi:hypothetical protein